MDPKISNNERKFTKPFATKRFKPRKQPIDRDEPTRQPPRVLPPREVPSNFTIEPKFKSTTYTAPNNDPLEHKDILLDGLAGYTHLKKYNFQNDYSGFQDVVEHTYTSIAALNKEFNKSVTLYMFSYYANILLWQRIYQIRKKNGKDIEFRSTLLDRSLPVLHIPQTLHQYLSGIGNIIDGYGMTWDLNFQCIPSKGTAQHGLTGSFGRLGFEPNYITMPSPYLTYFMMLYEFANHEYGYYPTLPTDIHRGGIPTENMIIDG